MLFNSYEFLLAFLPLVLLGFFLLRNQRARLAFLVVASYVFYGYADRWLPLLMIASTAVAYTGGRLIARTEDARRRKTIVAVGIVCVLGLLAYFKYAGFVAGYTLDIVDAVTGTGFPGVRSFTHGILLPIGISFYTFEAISYMVDVYRGTIPAERDPLRFLFFISFFPHLIAGPIVRYAKLGPQLKRFWRFDVDLFRSGVLLFSIGLVKKVLLADGIARWINPQLSHPSGLGFQVAWLSIIGFAFQIYFDFGGYSDMALGLGRMFGIELPWNFNRPYRAASPREFWTRWHVTLSTWLRDYLYIPLGGNRRGPRRRDANLFVTMGLGGLWHGASANFLLWGLYQGTLLVGNHHLARLRIRVPRVAAVALTFVLVTIGWVFFRMRTVGDTLDMFAAMAGANGLGQFPGHTALYVVISAVLMWGFTEEWQLDLGAWRYLRVATMALVTSFTIVSLQLAHPFIYFKF